MTPYPHLNVYPLVTPGAVKREDNTEGDPCPIAMMKMRPLVTINQTVIVRMIPLVIIN